jgi:hypothetical protein
LRGSLGQLIETVEELHKRECRFRSITEEIDTTTASGRLIFHIFGALAEFERSIIRERTMAGLEAARARGRRGGRPRVLTEERLLPEERLVVALNLGTARFRLGSAGLGGRIIVSSRCDRQGETIRDTFELHDDEGLVIELAADAQVPVENDMVLVGAGDQVVSCSESG